MPGADPTQVRDYRTFDRVSGSYSPVLNVGRGRGSPLYVSLASVDKTAQQQTTSETTALLAYLPVEDYETVTNTDERPRGNEWSHRPVEKIMEPLRPASKKGTEMFCASGKVRRCYPIVAGVVEDWPDLCMMGCAAEHRCRAASAASRSPSGAGAATKELGDA
ncbi:hypothetical protein FS749_006866 [Ceratobasidium sp. UAMH 11750]|nr:hypothetical protein FS749_006866 [Ceratobasidium sp. UAMH 11750]